MQLNDLMSFEYIEISLKKRKTWYLVELIRVNDRVVTVTLPKGLTNFFIGDEVICRFSEGKNTYIFDSEISEVSFKHPQTLVLYVPGQIAKFNEFRKEKRYCVKYLAEVYKLNTFYATVEDISYRGLCIHTTKYLEKGDDIAITILCEDREQITFEGVVVRRRDVVDSIEYGIEISSMKMTEEEKYVKVIELLEKRSMGDIFRKEVE